jgi:F-type H+-transporting ATPase subunit b
MLIDWFTVAAQIVNFLILLLLLRRFLYRPILNAMEERERKVASRLEEAEQKRVEAEKERQRYQEQNQELRKYYAEKQRQAEEEVESWRREALHAAREEVEATLRDWRQSVSQEMETFTAELRQFAVQQTYAIAGQAMQDLTETSLEERMVEVFLDRLKQGQIDLSALQEGRENRAENALTLRSAFELSPELRRRLQRELQAHFDQDLSLHFETSPNLIAGIELAGRDGYQLAWNLRRYLEALEEELEGQLHDQLHEQPEKLQASRNQVEV